jgi:hypothetical protein
MKRLNDTFTALANRSKEDWDWCGAITGMKRRGKSSLTLQLSQVVSHILESRVWLCYYYWMRDEEEEEIAADRKHLNLEQTNIYPASVQYALTNSQRGDVIWIDEAVNIVQKYKWNTPECRDFIDKNEVFGWKNLFIFMLQPEFSDFVKGFRTSRLKMHIWVKERGRVIVRIPKETMSGVNWKEAEMWQDDFPKLKENEELMYRQIKEFMLLKKERNGQKEDMKDYKRKIALRLLRKRILTIKATGELLDIPFSTIQRWNTQNP